MGDIVREGLINDYKNLAVLLTGVIGLESATYYHNLSTFGSAPYIRLADKKITGTSNYPFVYLPQSRPLTEDIELIADSLWVTNKERTICDLLLYDPNSEFLFQSLEDYLAYHGVEKDLMEYAIKYNCEKQLTLALSELEEVRS